MPLGPHVPAWKELHRTLHDLAVKSAAAFGAVVDLNNLIWCVATGGLTAGISPDQLDAVVDRFHETEIFPRAKALRRGARLSVARQARGAHYVAKSFAGIYVLVLWFGGRFDEARVRKAMEEALPRIEALVVALPPPDGSGGDEVALKLRLA